MFHHAQIQYKIILIVVMAAFVAGVQARANASGIEGQPLGPGILKLPPRADQAPSGDEVFNAVINKTPAEIQQRFEKEILSGNIPEFMRTFSRVHWMDTTSGSLISHDVTFWVAPDYLGIGEGLGYMRTPLSAGTAQRIADATGCLLPTTKMVDLIYLAAEQKLAPQPLSPLQFRINGVAAWKASNCLLQALLTPPSGFVAGNRKDIVITRRLSENLSPPRIAIYGWHKLDGNPIQPLTLVHRADYADYSHGVRLVSDTMLLDGETTSVKYVLTNPRLAHTLSRERPLTSDTIRYNHTL